MFSGAYSNHGNGSSWVSLRFSTVGIIRGEAHLPLNEVLTDAVGFGRDLISRQGRTPSPVVNDLRGGASRSSSGHGMVTHGRFGWKAWRGPVTTRYGRSGHGLTPLKSCG